MALTLNDAFLAMFVLLLGGMGVANFTQMNNNQDQTTGRPFFALLFIVLAIGLVAFKVTNP